MGTKLQGIGTFLALRWGDTLFLQPISELPRDLLLVFAGDVCEPVNQLIGFSFNPLLALKKMPRTFISLHGPCISTEY